MKRIEWLRESETAGAAPTPETDAPTPECDDWQLRYGRIRHWTDFARKLERERNEKDRQLAECYDKRQKAVLAGAAIDAARKK